MPSQDESTSKEPVKFELKLDTTLPSEEFTNLLVQHLKGLNLPSDTTSVEHNTTLDLWDFAGQHLYYASYPVFLSSRAVYILVYNLSKGLKNTAEPCVRQGVTTRLKNPSGETNLDNLLSWLVSVNTMSSPKLAMNGCSGSENDSPHLRPPVFIVGTHADKPFQDIEKMELQIQTEIYGKDFDAHVIRPLFSVTNMQGSSCDGICALQKRLIQVLKQEPYMGEEVPLR